MLVRVEFEEKAFLETLTRIKRDETEPVEEAKEDSTALVPVEKPDEEKMDDIMNGGK